MVQVLSKMIAFTLANFCNASVVLNRTPCSAHLPSPAITAIGVANPNPQGQAITSTPMKDITANFKASAEPMY